jgi:gamma-glutamylcysteine synthetase
MNENNVKDLINVLKDISKSLKFFEVLVLNDSNYTNKNKKDIDVNINKINEVVKDIKEKI